MQKQTGVGARNGMRANTAHRWRTDSTRPRVAASNPTWRVYALLTELMPRLSIDWEYVASS